MNTRQEESLSERPDDFLQEAVSFLREQNAGSGATAYLKTIANSFEQKVNKVGAEVELMRLEKLGVRQETLALGAMFFHFAPILDHVARTMFGDLRERKRKSKVLYEAAEIMRGVGKFMELSSLPPAHEFLKHFGYPSPDSTAEGLLMFAKFLFFREQLLKILNANSGQEISKYTLASAVHRITSKYHDREVSGIVGALLDEPDYDENKHRVWRIRTYPRLNRTAYVLPTMLHAFNMVLTENSDIPK
jgi:hypothetical protein